MPMSGYRSIAKSIIIAAAMTLSLMVSLPAEGPEPTQGTIWHIETIDTGDVGSWNSMALDSEGNPHIAYYDRSSRDLKYTSSNGTSWTIETVDFADEIGRWASLALDGQDNPHIAYHDQSNNELKYARWTGSAWTFESVEPACICGHAASLALNSTDTPHISYSSNSNPPLMYAKRIAPGSWTTEVLDASGWMNGPTSIAVDSKDNLHISYNMFTGSGHILKYAQWDGTAWNIEVVDDTGTVGWSSSLALDSQDRPHISHHDGYNQTLKYARWNGMAWIQEIVDSDGNVGECSSIVVDSKDSPHIAYYEDDNDDLKYTTWNGTSWNVELVDTFGWSGCRNSLATNGTDVPRISYHDYINGELRYAKKVEATLPSEPIIMDSILSGPNLKDVTIFWNRSADDGAGSNSVIRYDVYESEVYMGVYSWAAGVLASGSSIYDWTCLDCGEGDPNDHFFYVEANNSVFSTPSPNKAGKFARTLAQGPNLISIPFIQSNGSISNVLQTVEYDMAWFYDSPPQQWKWYMKSKEYRRGLWDMNHIMGLWVNVTEDSNLTVAGIVPAQTTIHLYEGWNLVSLPSFNSSYTVADLKVETGATRVEGYDPTPPYHLRVLGDAEVLLAGYGYWVKVDIDVDWIVEVS